jgi:hypothetical protein
MDAGTPPALPLLAVRAARAAVAADPDDANAYLRLGQAYAALLGKGGEPAAESPLLLMVRQAQAVWALKQALVLNPGLEAAHHALAELFLARNYLDAALDHLRSERDAARRAGRRPDETAEAFARRLADLEDRVAGLEETVQDNRNQFVIRAEKLAADPLGKARAALALGLAEAALDDVLLRSDVVLFGPAGARLQLSLLLMLGRTAEAREMLDSPELRGQQGALEHFDLPGLRWAGRALAYRLPAHEWLLTCAAAAAGDYDAAAEALAAMLARMEAQEASARARLRAGLAAAVAGEAAVGADPAATFARLTAREARDELTRAYADADLLRVELADLHALAGLLALEQGDTPAAAAHFGKALALARLGDGRALDFPGRAAAAACLRRLEAAGAATNEEVRP